MTMADSLYHHGPTMNRQLKTFEQLRSLIAQAVHQQQTLGLAEPRLIALPERDASGCNWAVAGWNTPSGAEWPACSELMQLVQSYQRQFNAVGRAPGNATAVLLPVKPGA